LENILKDFNIPEKCVSCDRYGQGHINETYLVSTDSGTRYILQKINESIFKETDALMENIEKVTDHLRTKTNDPRTVMQLVKTKENKPYLRHKDGSAWRMYAFVENSICLQMPETPEDFYESAVAFGNFQQMMKDFPAETLNETLPNFHNTKDRYRIFHEVLKKDPLGRAESVQKEIDFVLKREKEAGTLVDLLAEGKLPLGVTHNDTKLNNVLLDRDTRSALCVIYLDTVMPGLSLYDYGDSIRFGASTGAEDEKDLSKVNFDIELYTRYTRGFLEGAQGGLTKAELEYLPWGAKLMTLECGIRFLTDYLDGDHYFHIRYPKQNLDRCRTQFKLVQDMEQQFDKMAAVVAKYR
jgi:Ser/Thr protein kinase RdoA (MazF antagonist)